MPITNRKYDIAFWLIIVCIFILTIGQFIPIYFSNPHIRSYYYFYILLLLIVSIGVYGFQRTYSQAKKNMLYTICCSLTVGAGLFIIIGLYCLGLSLAFWTEAGICYINRNNPEVKIIRRYLDGGALGGNPLPSDYHVVLERPILLGLNLETSIDTNTINKKEWMKPAQ